MSCIPFAKNPFVRLCMFLRRKTGRAPPDYEQLISSFDPPSYTASLASSSFADIKSIDFTRLDFTGASKIIPDLTKHLSIIMPTINQLYDEYMMYQCLCVIGMMDPHDDTKIDFPFDETVASDEDIVNYIQSTLEVSLVTQDKDSWLFQMLGWVIENTPFGESIKKCLAIEGVQFTLPEDIAFYLSYMQYQKDFENTQSKVY